MPYSEEENKKHDVRQAVEMGYPLATSEIFDLANEQNVDVEYVMNVIQEYEAEKSNTKDEALTEYVKDTLHELNLAVDKRLPTFEEFYAKFKRFSYDENFSPEEVKKKFDQLTQDPNQLNLFEVRKRIRKVIMEVFSEQVKKTKK